ncbi:bleomycin resistance protein [Sphingobacterium suaedae]|uniref:Bleomycin resistance protein n=1 Tax=Sphingobacterium suaedae TaxID=1686402 RepID=A0ABW5KIB9_9SPHI
MKLLTVHPKLPMRHKATSLAFYERLGFQNIAQTDYPDYLMLQLDQVEIHFFLFPEITPAENYGQIYIRVSDIAALYASWLAKQIPIHPAAPLQRKPWGQYEFALLDPDNNLLTFGEACPTQLAK